MLRLLLLAALPMVWATPMYCPRRFHRLYTELEGKKSACDKIRTLEGFQYSITKCMEMACFLGGNTINFMQTKDPMNANQCDVLSCFNGDLKLVDSPGYSVLLNDYEKELRCTPDNERLLSCWTCKDAPDDETCELTGTFLPCLEADSKCGEYRERDTMERTWKVSRGCRAANTCTPAMYGHLGDCHRETYFHLNELIAGCDKCGYHTKYHRCYPVKPDLERAQQYEFLNGWIHFVHHHDGKEVTCPIIAQEQEGYTFEACQRLAVAMGGNIISHRYGEHCIVHKCDQSRSLNEQMENRDHGWNIFALMDEFQCNKDHGRILTCFSCDANTEKECREHGQMKDCPDNFDTCGHERTLGKYGEVLKVSRGCKKSKDCTNAMWNEDIYASCVAVDDRKLCSTCYFGNPGADHGCHEPFNKKCVNEFHEVKEDLSDKQSTTCTMLINQKFHWLESCMDKACDLNSNVVFFGGSQCEIYTCDLSDGKRPVFRNRKGHHLRFFMKK